jgi:hypothetical protein
LANQQRLVCVGERELDLVVSEQLEDAEALTARGWPAGLELQAIRAAHDAGDIGRFTIALIGGGYGNSAAILGHGVFDLRRVLVWSFP